MSAAWNHPEPAPPPMDANEYLAAHESPWDEIDSDMPPAGDYDLDAFDEDISLEEDSADSLNASPGGSTVTRFKGAYESAVWEAVEKELPPWGAAPGEDWREQALCSQVDPELWFPEQGGSSRKAKEICMQCPVRRECLKFALDNNERFGVWGGYSERERRIIARSRDAYLGRDSKQTDIEDDRVIIESDDTDYGIEDGAIGRVS